MRYTILIIAMLGLVAVVSALPPSQTVKVSADIGENYIQWSWTYANGSAVSVPVTVTINQVQVSTNFTDNMYLVQNLQPSERQDIIIQNGTATYGKATAITLMNSYVVYFLLGLCFLVAIYTFTMRDMVKFLLLSIFDIILAVLSASLSSGHGILPYLFFGVAAITGVILLVQGIPALRDQIDWL